MQQKQLYKFLQYISIEFYQFFFCWLWGAGGAACYLFNVTTPEILLYSITNSFLNAILFLSSSIILVFIIWYLILITLELVFLSQILAVSWDLSCRSMMVVYALLGRLLNGVPRKIGQNGWGILALNCWKNLLLQHYEPVQGLHSYKYGTHLHLC